MITLSVGKAYKTENGQIAHCIYADKTFDAVLEGMFLLVIEKTNRIFWARDDGSAPYVAASESQGLKIIREIPPRRTKTVFFNVYDNEEYGLYSGEEHQSLDEARKASGGVRVGVVAVELVNNIETGEVED